MFAAFYHSYLSIAQDTYFTDDGDGDDKRTVNNEARGSEAPAPPPGNTLMDSEYDLGNISKSFLNMANVITVVKHIPTTTVILIACVVGIQLLMIKKTEYQLQLYRLSWLFYGDMIVVCIQ